MGDVRAHIGWEGQFTDDQAVGAYPNGTRIEKIRAEANDTLRNGATGTVIGSLRGNGILGYFIEWDNMPRMAVFVGSHRVRRVTEQQVRKVHVWSAGTPLRGRA